MFNFIKKLLGISNDTHDSSPLTLSEQLLTSESHSNTDKYFEILAKLQEAISKREYKAAASLTIKSLNQIPALIKSEKQKYGSFDITSIPALEHGGTILALLGMKNELIKMKDLVYSTPALEPWRTTINKHLEDISFFTHILEVIAENPNCQQTDVKKLIGYNDGRRVANLLSWLDKAGKIVRTKKGKTYTLTLPDKNNTQIKLPKRQVQSHRTDNKAPKCREISLKNLTFIPLPRAPYRWEDMKSGRSPKPIKDATNWFEIRDTDQWGITTVDEIPKHERPDPAFRKIYPMDTGILMVDDLGKSEICSALPVAVIRFGREGRKIVEKPLLHDIYRIGVNPLGNGFIAISRECVAHAYDDSFNLLLETTMRDFPEVKALQKRLNIDDEQLKNHLRCVTMSFDNIRYLFTGVDEAWCIDMEGRCLWGVRLPPKEGWTKISEPSEIIGTSEEIMNALSIMDLNLPLTTDELKMRYRELAKKWHPDKNPNNPNAEEKMKKLNNAAEILTGIDSQALPSFTGATFMKEYSKHKFSTGGIEFTISMGMQVSEVYAADWIYAASFSGRNNSVYIASYSGKIVQLNSEGQPIRAYDIGAVPKRIIDTDDYLYFLTDTRLYVLCEDSLVALIDVLDAGELVMAQTGFGLLQKKCFQWFTEDGKHVGTVVTKNPIRRVYYIPQGMIVETRQRRAIINGVKTWWE